MNSAATAAMETILALVRRLAKDGDLPAVLASAPLGPETKLEAMGLDSVGKVNLLLAIDEELGIYIPEDAIHPETTLTALSQKIVG